MKNSKILKNSIFVVCVATITTFGVLHYNKFIGENKVKTKEIEKNKVQIEEKTINNKPKEIDEKKGKVEILSEDEIQNILGEKGSMFCITDIEKNEKEYLVTAYIEDEVRNISKTEFEKLEKGEEIEFRKSKWKKENNSQLENEIGKGLKPTEVAVIIKSENDERLLLEYDKNLETGFIENIAGARTGGLRDFSKEPIKFYVYKNVLVGGMTFSEFRYDENGEIKAFDYIGEEIENYKGITMEELLNICKTRAGSYLECIAFVKEGRIDAIQFMED